MATITIVDELRRDSSPRDSCCRTFSPAGGSGDSHAGRSSDRFPGVWSLTVTVDGADSEDVFAGATGERHRARRARGRSRRRAVVEGARRIAKDDVGEVGLDGPRRCDVRRAAHAGCGRPMSSERARGVGLGRVLVSGRVLVVDEGRARRVVLAAVGSRRSRRPGRPRVSTRMPPARRRAAITRPWSSGPMVRSALAAARSRRASRATASSARGSPAADRGRGLRTGARRDRGPSAGVHRDR
jgi:hypothetical protein